MSFDTERKKSGKRLVHIVDLVLDFCDLEYSVAPCQAVLGTTGQHKCTNTRISCQDPTNYTPSAKTYRFTEPLPGIPVSVAGIPSLRRVETAPTRIDPGRTLGKRASVTAEFDDHPHHDRGIDKYARERITGDAAADGSTFDPYEQGTFWGKFRARNLYYAGRKMHIYSGYIPWDHDKDPHEQDAVSEATFLANMQKRTYVIEKIEGPDARGRVSVTAKDVLKLADNDRAQCPIETTGRLSADITAGDTSATLIPSGIGDEEYPASGTARIGDELMTFTRSGDTLTLTRGTDGSTAESHDEDDQVQNCQRWTDTRVDTIAKELLEDFAGVDAAFIPFSDWQAEAETWLSVNTYSVVISEPTGVKKLLNELSEQSLCYFWWHEIDQEIKFKALHPERDALRTLTQDDSILADEFDKRDKTDERVTRVIVYFDRRDPTEKLDELTNYRQVMARVDTDAESSDEYDDKRTKTIHSRWFGANNRAQAVQLAARMLARYRNPPRHYSFLLGAKDAGLWTGDVFAIQHRLVQNERGEHEVTNVQSLEVDENGDGHYEHMATDTQFIGRYGFIGPDSLPDYGSASEADKQSYGFIAKDDETFANGDSAYKVV